MHFLDSGFMSGCVFHFRGNGRYGTGLFGVVSMLVGCPIIGAFTGWVFVFLGLFVHLVIRHKEGVRKSRIQCKRSFCW